MSQEFETLLAHSLFYNAGVGKLVKPLVLETRDFEGSTPSPGISPEGEKHKLIETLRQRVDPLLHKYFYSGYETIASFPLIGV